MNVFTYFDPDLESGPVGPIVRLWELSWRANGWEPRLLTPRLARRHPDFTPDGGYWEHFWLAASAIEGPHGGPMVDFRTFNNGLKPGDIDLCFPVPQTIISEFPQLNQLVHFSPEHTLAGMLSLGPYDLGKR